jgi:ATP-dependent DNA helicase HFM1/MER3
MDRRMFDQLNQLERGARDIHPRNDAHSYNGYNASQYNNDDPYHQQAQQYYQDSASHRPQYDPFLGKQHSQAQLSDTALT